NYMSDEDNGVEIVLEDDKKQDNDAPEVEIIDAEAEKQAKKAEKNEISPEEGILELKKNLEREKQARLEAEKRAHEAHQKAHQANADKNESDYQLVVNAIETVNSRNEQLKTAYADAMAAQDYSRAAEVQLAISANAQQLAELKKGEKSMKAQMDAAEKAPPAAQQGDLVDQLASQVSPRSASWLKETREHLKGERDIRKMFRAHEDAIDDGIVPDSDEYFEYIENRLGIRKNIDEKETHTSAENPLSAAAAPKKAVQPSPAPVSRGSSRPNVMRLTAAEAETAAALGMKPEEYAKNKALLQKEGRYGH
ncbi:MAG: hypothetical protein EB015_16085, partial [Methylocystaceae bacterium]|nr:hypothetical protein [Methylocystaceae bacterium]